MGTLRLQCRGGHASRCTVSASRAWGEAAARLGSRRAVPHSLLGPATRRPINQRRDGGFDTYFVSDGHAGGRVWVLRGGEAESAGGRGSVAHTEPFTDTIRVRRALIGAISKGHRRRDGKDRGKLKSEQHRDEQRRHDSAGSALSESRDWKGTSDGGTQGNLYRHAGSKGMRVPCIAATIKAAWPLAVRRGRAKEGPVDRK